MRGALLKGNLISGMAHAIEGGTSGGSTLVSVVAAHSVAVILDTAVGDIPRRHSIWVMEAILGELEASSLHWGIGDTIEDKRRRIRSLEADNCI